MNSIKNFHRDEDGAITLDWVVLSAIILVVGAKIGSIVLSGANDAVDSLNADVATIAEQETTIEIEISRNNSQINHLQADQPVMAKKLR